MRSCPVRVLSLITPHVLARYAGPVAHCTPHVLARKARCAACGGPMGATR